VIVLRGIAAAGDARRAAEMVNEGRPISRDLCTYPPKLLLVGESFCWYGGEGGGHGGLR
jgi:hypothetical protein